jgi:hypothetical protein
MVDAGSISVVLAVLHPERDALVAMLESFETEDWSRSTECPAYTVKGIAIHVLGDDLSLLSRQRDGAENGLVQLAAEMPGADFRTLLDAFNDRWVAAGRFLSIDLVIELLRLSGDWTAGYYEEVDPAAPGEPVRLLRRDRFHFAVLARYREGVHGALGAPLTDPPRSRARIACGRAVLERRCRSRRGSKWGRARDPNRGTRFVDARSRRARPFATGS